MFEKTVRLRNIIKWPPEPVNRRALQAWAHTEKHILPNNKIQGHMLSAVEPPQKNDIRQFPPYHAKGPQRNVINLNAQNLRRGATLAPPEKRAFNFSFAAVRAYTYTAGCYQNQGVLLEHYQNRWETRREPLWSGFVTTRFKGSIVEERAGVRRTVRSLIVRRLRTAFALAMENNGFTKDGTRLDGSGRNIFGTVQFVGEQPALMMSTQDILPQMDYVVKCMISSQKWESKRTEQSQQGSQRAGGKKASKPEMGINRLQARRT
ncbi:hypothetical protein B0O99DRAFT_608439 [Bisporella sp. PMI_857]|nr:hypothetical protein B0O99DRAFT_608439 [Bisporella sp. PMI_857]